MPKVHLMVRFVQVVTVLFVLLGFFFCIRRFIQNLL